MGVGMGMGIGQDIRMGQCVGMGIQIVPTTILLLAIVPTILSFLVTMLVAYSIPCDVVFDCSRYNDQYLSLRGCAALLSTCPVSEHRIFLIATQEYRVTRGRIPRRLPGVK